MDLNGAISLIPLTSYNLVWAREVITTYNEWFLTVFIIALVEIFLHYSFNSLSSASFLLFITKKWIILPRVCSLNLELIS